MAPPAREATGDLARGALASLGNKPLLVTRSLNSGGQATTGPQSLSASSDEVPTVPDSWVPALNSDFSTGDQGNWPDIKQERFTASLGNGTWDMAATNGGLGLSWPSETNDWADGGMQVSAKVRGTGLFGIVARYSSSGDNRNLVGCGIDNTGLVFCTSVVNGENKTILNDTSSAIKPNGVNEIALLAIGQNFTFVVNNKKIKSFTAPDPKHGTWALLLQAPDSSPTSALLSTVIFYGPLNNTAPAQTPAPQAQPTVYYAKTLSTSLAAVKQHRDDNHG